MEIIREVREARKRIWQVDCLSMDAALAGSFDWRELDNFLKGAGCRQPAQEGPETLLDLNVQGAVHQQCHSENPLSVRVESLLNRWHAETIVEVSRLGAGDLMRLVIGYPFRSRFQTAALFWALGTDPRPDADGARRRFHQRFQTFSVRRLA